MICWGDVSSNWEQQKHQEIWPEVDTLQATNDKLWLLCKDGSLQTLANEKEGFEKMCSEVADVFASGEQVFTVDKEGQAHRLHSSGEVEHCFGKKKDAGKVPRPTLSKKKIIVQISCGQSHTLMLSKYGDIYVAGDNSCGQLGLSKKGISAISEPQILDSMKGVPISQIAAGSRYSFCVTVSGRAFAWGLNDLGQLGLGDLKRKRIYSPKLLKSFTKHAIAFISAGRHHCALLTKKGELFTFGQNSHGQLGHGNTSQNELTPRRVKELEDSVVTQVSCGQGHTIAFAPGCGQLFVFGSNNEGQLGLPLEKGNITEPEIASGPWCNGDKTWVKKVYAFGNQTFILLATSADQCNDDRLIASHRRIATLCENHCVKIEKYDEETLEDVLEDLRCTLGSQSCLNGSFSMANERPMSEDFLDIDFIRARQVVLRLCKSDNPEVSETIVESLSKDIVRNLSDNPPDIEALKLYLILPNIVKFLLDCSGKNALIRHRCLENVFIPFVEKMLRVPQKPLRKLYKLLDLQDFSSCISLCKDAITDIIFGILRGIVEQNQIQYPLQMLKMLFEINGDYKMVDYKEFYIQCLSRVELLRLHFTSWKPIMKLAPGTDRKSNICHYPFVLDAKAKTVLLEINSKVRLRALYQPNRLPVDRQNILSSASKQLDKFSNMQLPLEVQFVGEAGDHDGALNKTFFMLIFKELLLSKYGLFDENETSKLLWFSKGEVSSLERYGFIGKLCGMALYNNIIVNFNIPLALYKQLLDQEPDFDDFKKIDPVVGNSLQQLLDFEEDDDSTVEEEFGLHFTSPDRVRVPLKKGGEDIPLTVENREEYIKLFLDYFFQKSVKDRLEAFCKGFWMACDLDMLQLFRAEELMEMVTGIQDYDWDTLKRSTKYQSMNCKSGGFDELHPVIKWFWEVLLSMTKEENDRFLVFITGSNKIPVTGVSMTICQREENDHFLPEADVCFNRLHLHSYSSKEILEKNLKLAIRCEECHNRG